MPDTNERSCDYNMTIMWHWCELVQLKIMWQPRPVPGMSIVSRASPSPLHYGYCTIATSVTRRAGAGSQTMLSITREVAGTVCMQLYPIVLYRLLDCMGCVWWHCYLHPISAWTCQKALLFSAGVHVTSQDSDRRPHHKIKPTDLWLINNFLLPSQSPRKGEQ